MDEAFKQRVKQSIVSMSRTIQAAAYNLGRYRMKDYTPVMLSNIEAQTHGVLLIIKELYDSREAYQKAADEMAAAHKVEREQLTIELERYKTIAELNSKSTRE